MSDDIEPIIHKIEGYFYRQTLAACSGPSVRIIHRFRKPGTICAPGEEIGAIYLLGPDKSAVLHFSLTLRLLFDYVASRRMPLSPTQIADGLRASLFHNQHGMNAGTLSRRRFSRSAIKEYVRRIRGALQLGIEEVGLSLDPSQVLISDGTVSNEVRYRIKAQVEWWHEEDISFNVNCSRLKGRS